MAQRYTAAEAKDLPAAIDLQTVCNWLGISRNHGYNQLRQGTFPIPALRIGNLYRFRSADLIKFLGLDG